MSQPTDQPLAAPPAGESVPQAPDRHTPLTLPWLATWLLIISLSAILNAALVFATHGSRGFFIPVLAAIICSLAALLDGCTQRIPNPLTYTAILLGLGLNALVPLLDVLHAQSAITWLAANGLQSSLLGFFVCAFFALLAPLIAGLHGGDLKLLAAVGAMLGLTATGNVILFALTFAVAYALLNLALVGRLNSVFQIAAQRALELIYLRRFITPLPDEPRTRLSHIPMAIPLALAMIVLIIWQIRFGGGGGLL